jgi:hypothetical protein
LKQAKKKKKPSSQNVGTAIKKEKKKIKKQALQVVLFCSSYSRHRKFSVTANLFHKTHTMKQASPFEVQSNANKSKLVCNSESLEHKTQKTSLF